MPIDELQTGDATEFSGVVSDERQIICQCNCGNHQIVRSNRRTFRLKVGADLTVELGCQIVERQTQEYRKEGGQQSKIRRRIWRLERPEIEFSNYNRAEA